MPVSYHTAAYIWFSIRDPGCLQGASTSIAKRARKAPARGPLYLSIGALIGFLLSPGPAVF